MRILLILIVVLPVRIFSQDFTGVWTGYIFTSNIRLPYELVISESNNKLKGYSLTVFTINNIENTGIKTMKIKGKKGKISIEDDDLIFNDYEKRPRRVVLYSTLSLEEDDDSILVLQGSFFTRSLDRSTFTGTIRLEKSKNFSEARMVPQLKKMDRWNELSIPESETNENTMSSVAVAGISDVSRPDSTALTTETTIAAAKSVNKSDVANLPEQKRKIETVGSLPGGVAKPAVVARTIAEDIASRKTEVIRSIYVQSDSLVLSLYDNGEVDGDTVSVVVNDKVIIARQGLGINAIIAHTYTPGHRRFVAAGHVQNLGRIPPNTGLLIVQDGDERHQIRFSGDYQKNSAIILRRKR